MSKYFLEIHVAHLLTFLLLIALVSCSPGGAAPSARTLKAPGVPAASAAPAEAPLADFAVPGRLLAAKEGSIFQWNNGAFKLVAGGVRYQDPAFSPDGSRIAATIVGDNHSDLLVLDATGKRLAQLTDHWSKVRVQDSAWARRPAWSPDGRRIAYASDAVGYRISDALGVPMSLLAVDAAGGNRRQLVPAPGMAGLDWPSWSPSGRDVALVEFDLAASQVVRVTLATGAYRKLTEHAGGAYDPAWSPDGGHIAYVTRVAGRNDIWLMESDGSNPVRLTDIGTARAPTWSPAGDLIAFVAEQGRGFDLYAIQTNLLAPALVPTSALKRLTSGQNLDAPSGVSWAR